MHSGRDSRAGVPCQTDSDALTRCSARFVAIICFKQSKPPFGDLDCGRIWRDLDAGKACIVRGVRPALRLNREACYPVSRPS